MKKLIDFIWVISFLLLCVLSNSCNKEETPKDPVLPAESVEEAIDMAGTPDAVFESTDSTTLSEEIDFAGNFKCEEFEVDITQARGDYRTFDPNTEIIWPGNLIQGASISKSTPDPIVVERAGGEFTINLINGSNSMETSASVTEVDQTRVVGALNDILGNNNGLIPANFTYNFSQVQSQSELALKMGVNVSTLTTDVKTDLAFSTERSYNRVLVDFSQIYYSMIYEKPTSYEQVFAPSVTADDLAPYLGNGNPPLYISSVTYGRRLYVLIESTSSSTEMEAAIDVTYGAALAQVSGSVEVNHVKNLSEVKIKIFAMGGNASDALAAFNGDFSALKTYLQSDDQDYLRAAPLSYVMRTLAPPQQIVDIKVSTQFTVSKCTPLYEIAPPAWTAGWYNVFDGEGIGTVAALDAQQNNAIIFNKAGTHYVLSQGGVVGNVIEMAGGSHILANCPLDSIGVAQINGGRLYLFNRDGTKFTTTEIGTNSWGGPYDLYQWGVDNSHPFLAESGEGPGVGAALFYTDNRSIHFNRSGFSWVVYNSSNGGSFGGVNAIHEWGTNHPDWRIPFLEEGVGSAVQLKASDVFHNPNSPEEPAELIQQILFNKDGTKFAIYNGSKGFSPAYSIVKE